MRGTVRRSQSSGPSWRGSHRSLPRPMSTRPQSSLHRRPLPRPGSQPPPPPPPPPPRLHSRVRTGRLQTRPRQLHERRPWHGPAQRRQRPGRRRRWSAHRCRGTITRHDGPNHLGLWVIFRLRHKNGPNHLGFWSRARTGQEGREVTDGQRSGRGPGAIDLAPQRSACRQMSLESACRAKLEQSLPAQQNSTPPSANHAL